MAMTRVTAAALLLLVLPAVPAYTQKFSSRTLAVRVDVLVTDGRNPVAGLAARDFELRDNGVVQRIELVDAGEVPINVVLALDTSDSIRGRRQADLIAAGETLLGGLKPADRAALTTFSDIVVPQIALTSDFDGVRRALREMEPQGQTAVTDGAYVALVSTLDQSGRFMVVVCTDGADTASWLRTADVVDVAKRSNAVVYAVTSADARRSEGLKQLAEATGGQVMAVRSSGELRGTFERILAEFRSRYVLAFTPEGVSPGGFHRIDVTVPQRRATVKARAGYAGAAGTGQQ